MTTNRLMTNNEEGNTEMVHNVLTKLQAVQESDLGLDPDFSAPWIGVLRDVAGWTVGSLFIISGIMLAIGIVMFLVAKAVSNSRQQESGVKAILIGLLGVLLLGGVGSLLVFAAGFDPFTATSTSSLMIHTLR